MIRLKKILSIIIISLIFTTEINAAIKDGLFATVGNKAITKSDIITEIKIILILNGQSYSEERKEQLESAAVNSVIMRKIKEIELERYNDLDYDKNDLNIELKKLANNLNIDVDTFRNIFVNNDIDFSFIVDRIKTELLWNTLIFQLYKSRLLVNIDEIDQQLQSYQENQEITEYLISEIIIGSIPQSDLETEVEKIKNKIKSDGFEKVAMDLSISETGVKGGDLGWVDENVITEKFKDKIINTPLGEISEPIFLPEGILFLKVRDKRKKEKIFNLEKAKDELVAAEKSKILNMQSLSHYDTLKRTIAINYF